MKEHDAYDVAGLLSEFARSLERCSDQMDVSIRDGYHNRKSRHQYRQEYEWSEAAFEHLKANRKALEESGLPARQAVMSMLRDHFTQLHGDALPDRPGLRTALMRVHRYTITLSYLGMKAERDESLEQWENPRDDFYKSR